MFEPGGEGALMDGFGVQFGSVIIFALESPIALPTIAIASMMLYWSVDGCLREWEEELDYDLPQSERILNAVQLELRASIYKGDLERVKAAVAGVAPEKWETVCRWAEHPLIWASHMGNVPVLEALWEAGANWLWEGCAHTIRRVHRVTQAHGEIKGYSLTLTLTLTLIGGTRRNQRVQIHRCLPVRGGYIAPPYRCGSLSTVSEGRRTEYHDRRSRSPPHRERSAFDSVA